MTLIDSFQLYQSLLWCVSWGHFGFLQSGVISPASMVHLKMMINRSVKQLVNSSLLLFLLSANADSNYWFMLLASSLESACRRTLLRWGEIPMSDCSCFMYTRNVFQFMVLIIVLSVTMISTFFQKLWFFQYDNISFKVLCNTRMLACIYTILLDDTPQIPHRFFFHPSHFYSKFVNSLWTMLSSWLYYTKGYSTVFVFVRLVSCQYHKT